MKASASNPGDRVPLFITIGVFLVMAACVPLVLISDRNIDEDRPMYKDLLRMETMQTSHVAGGGSPVVTTVADGESVEIGVAKFVASAGVTVSVTASDRDSFCVDVSNDAGAHAERCSG